MEIQNILSVMFIYFMVEQNHKTTVVYLSIKMIKMKFQQALQDPTSVFDRPEEVFDDSLLSKEQKIKILRRWEYDARELEVAEEENMRGNKASMLRDVLIVLNKLGAQIDLEHTPPTKQGGGK